MKEYIFVQIILVIVAVTVGIRIFRNIGIDRRINRVFVLGRSPARYMDSRFERLPERVGMFIEGTGAKGRQAPRRLKMNFRGMVRKKTGKDWWRFILKTYVNLDRSAFLIDGCLRLYPGIRGRFIDEWDEGKSRFELLLSSMFKYMEGDGEIFDYNATLHFMLFQFMSPIHLVQEEFAWQASDDGGYDLSYTHGAVEIRARVFLDEQNRINRVRSERFRAYEGSYYLQSFEARFEQFKTVDQCLLPTIVRFGWLYEGQFQNFANFELIKYETEKTSTVI